jgi:hypothetical protein
MAQQQYPPPQQQYPPAQQQQYPPAQQQQQYPPAQQQQQYPPAQQQQYPPAQQQYPPAQQQYPPAQQQQYPPQQYPPQQGYPEQAPPPMPPAQLDQVVQRIALYPDPLLAQILTASSYYNQIPEAAAWANQHSYLHGDSLSQAVAEDQLPWDPSILALLPFPSVLNMMAQDPGWTQALGNAVLADRASVMDAIQRQRQAAEQYGYLQSNNYVRVVGPPGDIEILPLNPGVIYVPTYNPYVVFAPPRPGIFVGGALRFGPGITIGAGFMPFGWAGAGIGWRAHNLIIDNHPWVRTWGNRGVYVHPYAHPMPHYTGHPVERHGRDRDRRH